MTKIFGLGALFLFGFGLLGCCDNSKSKSESTTEAKETQIEEKEKNMLVIMPFDNSTNDLASAIRLIREKEKKKSRKLLVYVGATWCEPCVRFHRAAEQGKLDETFGDLTLLEFDYDKHHEALEKAGYTSRLVPLFALPRSDGKASGLHIEGSIKGEGAVAEITPRLKKLLSKISD